MSAHEKERIFKSLFRKCVRDTVNDDMLEAFDLACGTHLRTHRIDHEWEAFFEFICDYVFPKWIDCVIGRELKTHP